MFSPNTQINTSTPGAISPKSMIELPNLITVIDRANPKDIRTWFQALSDEEKQFILNTYLTLLADEALLSLFDDDQLTKLIRQRENKDFKFSTVDDFELLSQVMISVDTFASSSFELYIFLQQKNLVRADIVKDWYCENITNEYRHAVKDCYLDMLGEDEKFERMMLTTPADFKPLLKSQRDRQIFNPVTLEDFTLIDLMMINLNPLPHLEMSLYSYSQKREVAKNFEKSAAEIPTQRIIPSSVSRKNWSVSKFILALAALTMAIILLPISTFAYSISKLSKAISNLSRRHKIARSLWRFAAFYLGVGAGILVGLATGAIIGSVIPGMGTVAGAIVGAICASSISSALCIFVVKEVNRLLSWCTVKLGLYGSEKIINPTNPNKYRLNAAEKKIHADAQAEEKIEAVAEVEIIIPATTTAEITIPADAENATARIYDMMAAIKKELTVIKRMAPGTEQQQAKQEYLQLLAGVKTRPSVSRGGFFQHVNSNTWFQWNGNRWVNGAKESLACANIKHCSPRHSP